MRERVALEKEVESLRDKEGDSKVCNINSINDFIDFLRKSESYYKNLVNASAYDVLSEIRQIWYGNVFFSLLVGSQGVVTTKDGKTEYLDIEDKSKVSDELYQCVIQLSQKSSRIDPCSGKLKESTEPKSAETPLGNVDLGHLVIGVDSAMSGFPKPYPKVFLEDKPAPKLKWYEHKPYMILYYMMKMRALDDPKAFATWAGDLGSAYAEYLYCRWCLGNKKANLCDFTKYVAADDELRADIHGYLAAHVYTAKTGKTLASSGSEIFHYFYSNVAGGDLVRYFLQVNHRSPMALLQTKIKAQSLSFASLFFFSVLINRLREASVDWMKIPPSWPDDLFLQMRCESVRNSFKAVMLRVLLSLPANPTAPPDNSTIAIFSREFHEIFMKVHEENEKLASPENKIDCIVEHFTTLLKGINESIQDLPVWDLRNQSQGGNGPLTLGSSGNDVKTLQTILVALGHDLGEYGPHRNGIDGSFGDKTKEAVRKIQSRNLDFMDIQLKQDGVVGPLTSDVLNRLLVCHWCRRSKKYETDPRLKQNYNEISTGKKVKL